ncbi:amino acid/amide ABC transporter substrate-binding protein, HAAT family [Desulfuromonas soudanensis]|uniref:Amino acid/amide ABC transporter substrate-binding protein, HAAT family n=1 Tax=Desulfuromonas soudanensis TaxID=1603606 RepID=A0A0M4D6W7_9BACT|nr:ABC transporter substrate-binding protein [Desulfuromonas soudanensis]ALC15117.1 amino acid/amide ABC transporter substrate-binding protein, HAAT family [Desulfuromonas soudanensis]
MKERRLKRAVLGIVIVLLMLATPVLAAEQYIAMLSFRVGPYAAGGTGFYGGYIDYLDMLNKRDGGINGVKLTWEECETEYKNDRGVECYERLKNNGPTGASVIIPLSTGITYSLIDRVNVDKLPLVTMGYGRSDAADGRVFPYVFPVVTSYWSQNTAKIKYIGSLEGGMDKLKGKKIVNLYHGSAYGKETMGLLDLQAAKYGFTVTHIEVPHPGNEQQSQWMQIRQMKPDWVILRGWGVMNSVALKTAQKVGFPANRMIGGWWSGAEEDVIPAGDAAKNFVTAAFHPSGVDFPVIQDILKHVYAKGGTGNMTDPKRIGQQYFNRGVIQGILVAEAIRTGQEKYGKRSLTGEEMRWGFENLDIDDKRLKELGAHDLLQPLKLSCMDHEGGGAVKFQRWNGDKWEIVSDWIPSDQEIVRPEVEKSAAKYAAEKGITLRNCTQEAKAKK